MTPESGWEYLNPDCPICTDGRKVHGDDVETERSGSPAVFRHPFTVDSCQSTQSLPLLQVDGELCRDDRATGTGLYFDEAQNVPVPSDQVDIPGQLRCVPTTGDDHIAVPSEVEEGLFLPAQSRSEVRRGGTPRRNAGGQQFHAAHNALRKRNFRLDRGLGVRHGGADEHCIDLPLSHRLLQSIQRTAYELETRLFGLNYAWRTTNSHFECPGPLLLVNLEQFRSRSSWSCT